MRCIVLLTAAICLASGCDYRPGYQRDVQRIVAQLESTTSPEEVRSSLDHCITILATNIASGATVPVGGKEIPKWIYNLSAPYPLVGVRIESALGTRIVHVVWASGRGVCGIDVNMTTNSILSRQAARYVVEWKPGIEVWHSRTD